MARALLLSLSVVMAAASEPPGGENWKFDIIHRHRGEPLKGLVVEQSAKTVKVRCITRKPGSPTLVFTESIPREEISRMELLEKDDRILLENRLEVLKQERDTLTDQLRLLNPASSKGKASGPSDVVDLRQAPWPGNGSRKAYSYESTYFKLLADTGAELAQLAAIHLEQIFAAYARSLPPTTRTASPTLILLTASQAEYQAQAKERGLQLFNPAFYDPNRNEVVCGSRLEGMYQELRAIRDHHERLRASIKDRRAELQKVYRGKIPPELLAPMIDAEKRMDAAEKRNQILFDRQRVRFFQRLYHEAFHAYLKTFVSSPGDGSLPIWLNEGMAQIFENAIVEIGELRVGHAEPERLTALRGSLARGTLLPLADLLQSGPKNFQVAIPSDQQVSDRHYLASWALAHYLSFELQLMGNSKLKDYCRSLQRGTDPLLAFRDLVGKPIPEFEKEFLRYLSHLRSDGSKGS